jgi:hypothetical protein
MCWGLFWLTIDDDIEESELKEISSKLLGHVPTWADAVKGTWLCDSLGDLRERSRRVEGLKLLLLDAGSEDGLDLGRKGKIVKLDWIENQHVPFPRPQRPYLSLG